MTQMYKVYQIQIDANLSELINREGWNCHEKATAYADAMCGMFEMALARFDSVYTHVADVIADDLDHVFEVGNIGPADRIVRKDKMTSISVGNIIEDQQGVRHIVASNGFELVEETV